MDITGSATGSERALQRSPTLTDLDASVGLYESGSDNAVAVRYRGDAELLAAVQHRRSELPAD